MINRDVYRNFLLANMYGASSQSGGREVVCKCKYCPDDGSHYHMSISIPDNEYTPSFHNCWKCHTSGIVTYKKLLEWGIYNADIAQELTQHNSAVFSSDISNQYYYRIIPRDLTTLRNPSNDIKLKYINDRLGLSLTYDQLSENNIILNLIDFLNINRITSLTRDPRIVKSLSDNFVGFLSMDGNFISLRCITDHTKLYKTIANKYIIYNITGSKDNTLKFIIDNTVIDYTKPMIVNIAEGPFDMISVKYNILELYQKTNNVCNIAVTGNTYLAPLRYLILENCLGLTKTIVNIYADNDKAGFYPLKNLMNELSVFHNIRFNIHINEIGKDFGVPKKDIKDIIITL